MYINKRKYQALIKEKPDKALITGNCLRAFLFGGGLCLSGELLIMLYQKLGLDKKDSQTVMILTVILLASVLSAVGVYDKLGQIAKAGFLVPISGFANGAVSSAMEFKSEGFLLGLGANVFKLVGSVVVLGVFFGTLVGTIKYIWSLI